MVIIAKNLGQGLSAGNMGTGNIRHGDEKSLGELGNT